MFHTPSLLYFLSCHRAAHSSPSTFLSFPSSVSILLVWQGKKKIACFILVNTVVKLDCDKWKCCQNPIDGIWQPTWKDKNSDTYHSWTSQFFSPPTKIFIILKDELFVFIFRCSSPSHNPVHVRRVDPSTLAFILSSHLYSFVGLLFTSRFSS